MSIITELTLLVFIGSLMGVFLAASPLLIRLLNNKVDFYKAAADEARANVTIAKEQQQEKKKAAIDNAALISTLMGMLDNIKRNNEDDD